MMVLTPGLIWGAFSLSILVSGAEYEWAGIFDTPEDVYLWTAQKVDGEYADPAMKLAALPSAVSSASELDKLETEGNQALTLTCVKVTPGSTIIPSKNTCYQLEFDQDMWQSLYKINAAGSDAIAFFAEHVPTEFESTAHYLKDASGEDIEPAAELTPEGEGAAEETKPYGAVIGAALLVNFVTLIGVVFLVPAFLRLASKYEFAFEGIICGFAAGALLSCAFFLLLFEATHLIGTGWTEEVDILWRWGVMILAGFILPTCIDSAVSVVMLFVARKGSKGTTTTASDAVKTSDDAAVVANAAELNQVGVSWKVEEEYSSRARIIGGVLIGDFFHNLCDGFFLGAAFMGCGDSFGWGVALATILHELPQELADYAILTQPAVAFGAVKALVANFVSGLSVILGAVIIMESDVSDAGTGLMLAFGGGIYLNVAAVECMPKIYSAKLSVLGRITCLGAFVLGAVLIGLILIGHEHCVPEGEAHAH